MTAELQRLLALERYRNLAVMEAAMEAERNKPGPEQESTGRAMSNLILQLQEENRRLHALNTELLAALVEMVTWCPSDFALRSQERVYRMAQTAIANAKEKQQQLNAADDSPQPHRTSR